jgi:DNA-binding transcriptional LysR family regulator
MLDRSLRNRQLLGRINIAVEAGGWQTILAYVSDGFGVGVVREDAIPRSAQFIVRVLDADCCPPAVTKVICRYRADTKSALDLSDQGQFWYDTLVKAAKQQED